ALANIFSVTDSTAGNTPSLSRLPRVRKPRPGSRRLLGRATSVPQIRYSYRRTAGTWPGYGHSTCLLGYSDGASNADEHAAGALAIAAENALTLGIRMKRRPVAGSAALETIGFASTGPTPDYRAL